MLGASVPGRAAVWGRAGTPKRVMNQRAYQATSEGQADQNATPVGEKIHAGTT